MIKNICCKEGMRQLADNSIDSIVTDPPYELGFMGKKWDKTGIAYDPEVWAECLRVLKPGGYLLSFSSSRTYHRMTVAIEDAGFEIRDSIIWLYGSGFPKSLDVSKAINKDAGHWRGKAGNVASVNTAMSGGNYERTPKGAPITDQAKQWQGWGTALKPAHEPICVARKPLLQKTVADNVLLYGTGAINIDDCRVPGVLEGDPNRFNKTDGGEFVHKFNAAPVVRGEGRYPANLIHDGLDESWTRYFYCAKTSKTDRNEGLEHMELKNNMRVNAPRENEEDKHATLHQNNHPTVKPTELMRYLCRLVTPPNGIVLDPFSGSGSTGKAAVLEGFRFIGFEKEPEYAAIANSRVSAALCEDLIG